MRRHGISDPLSVHRAWIGLVQPDGIVVSPAALVDAGLAPDPLAQGETDALRRLCGLEPASPREREAPPDPQFLVRDALARVFVEVLGCDPEWIRGTQPHPFGDDLRALERVLPEFNAEVLAPSYALKNPNTTARHASTAWLCLLKELPGDWDLDRPHGDHSAAHWVASPMAKFERLLRETGIAIGVIANGRELRLVYAPPGEGAGVMAFPLELLLGTEGETVLGALVMLLGRARWLDAPPGDGETDLDKRFLPRVLAESRKYQNNVSTQLSEQVLDALWELLRGLQAAHEHAGGRLLRDWIPGHPEEVYGALLAVLLRLVFLLYAEDRDQLPTTGFYPASYGVRALYEKLRDDAGRHPDTMDLRLGAWARLLATFRLVHQGGGHGATHLPPREGALFSPDTHPLLEGRPRGSLFQRGEALDVPAVPDGVVFRVLDRLVRIEREDLSYKTLGVEELGSVYESIMGFTVETTVGPSLALRPDDVVVDLGGLLKVAPTEREKFLKTRAGTKLTGKGASEALRAATTVDALADALARVRSPRTPAPVPAGTLVLQPTEERRRSGSHYTPRTLTAPIVDKTLAPVLASLGEHPTHAQILALKVCDPAMGSGAFLVAACRALGDKLYEAWQRDGGAGKPREVATIVPDVDERVVARRLVAQHCLYGVDKNPFAVDLARLSLWLETLAKEHPFTFLDHCLRDGDSLVGATRAQIERFSLDPPKKAAQLTFLQKLVADGVKVAMEKRAAIRTLALSDDTPEKRRLLDDAREAVTDARLAGDVLVAVFFAETKDTARKKRMEALQATLANLPDATRRREAFRAETEGLGFKPFHWELEFPEVFERENPGFDAVVGNPPFAGKNTLIAATGEGYIDWLKAVHEDSHGNADLVAHFFRRAFAMLRQGGAFGLIATNTIAQGDTRTTGLRWICTHGGAIYDAQRRYRWPGTVAVRVSVVHVFKGKASNCLLDGMPVPQITAFLFPRGGHDDAVRLDSNDNLSFVGSFILGMGFTFDDENPDATPISTMEALLAKNSRNRERIFPFIGGEELNTDPAQRHRRYVINFEQMTEEQARQWPDLMSIVEAKVKPERMKLGNSSSDKPRKDRWWLWGRYTPGLFDVLRGKERILANSQVTAHMVFAFQPNNRVFSHTMNVYALPRDSVFATLQSRVHEAWARFFSSTSMDLMRYTPSDCFETFPFPVGVLEAARGDVAVEDLPAVQRLEELGKKYYELRAKLMIENDEGLTATCNRFHDPDNADPGIARLRDLHAAMDRAVLDAYGWKDLAPTHAFIDEHGEDEEGDGGASARGRRRSVRLRWPDEFRDEVLARLIALNAERAAAEEAARKAKEAAEGTKPTKRRGAK